MLRFQTKGYSACSVVYSPYLDNRLAVGASANFGLVGNGRLFILDINPDATIQCFRSFDTQDSVFCSAWSETHENHIITGGGDGGVRYFDVVSNEGSPLHLFKEHRREVFGVNWNLIDKSQFCSCSWDGTIKLWTPQASSRSLLTVEANQACVYEAKFAPSNPTSILSAHGDATAKLWDIRQPHQPQAILASSQGDCLTVDWNKYQPTTVATAGSDKIIRIFDLRNPAGPLTTFTGHQLAVKSIKWSPHSAKHLLSASYDMTAKVWVDDGAPSVPGLAGRGLARDFTHHSEFVADVDWSLWGEPGWAASVGWDQMLYIWKGF